MDDLDDIAVLEEVRNDGISRFCDKVRVRISFWLLCPDYAGDSKATFLTTRKGLMLVAFLCGFSFAKSKVRALVCHLGQIREFGDRMRRLERTRGSEGWVFRRTIAAVLSSRSD